MCSVNDVVVPGDTVKDLQQSEATKKTLIGPGLRRQDDAVIVTRPGILKFREPCYYWVDCHHKRYIPARGEHVIGIVIQKAGDVFKVDIGGSDNASLSYLAFEGATKRNRPAVVVGDLIYGKLAVANKDMEPELVCIDSMCRSNGMGVLGEEGFMFKGSLSLARKILSQECKLLAVLGNSLQYETAVGMNGRIWVKGRSVPETIAIANVIESSEYMDNTQIKQMCKRLVDALAGF